MTQHFKIIWESFLYILLKQPLSNYEKTQILNFHYYALCQAEKLINDSFWIILLQVMSDDPHYITLFCLFTMYTMHLYKLNWLIRQHMLKLL